MAQNFVAVGTTDEEKKTLLMGEGWCSNENELQAIAAPDIAAGVTVPVIAETAFGSTVAITDINKNRLKESDEGY